jgi:hypothetical protein
MLIPQTNETFDACKCVKVLLVKQVRWNGKINYKYYLRNQSQIKKRSQSANFRPPGFLIWGGYSTTDFCLTERVKHSKNLHLINI